MTERKVGPITVRTESVDDPVDIDRWVERYVEIGMRIQGVAPGGGLLAEGERRITGDEPVPASSGSR